MGHGSDTEELARRAAAGDSTALDHLLLAIGPRVLEQCGRFLPCRQDAEEAAQDALVQVARHIARFEGRSLFSTWLHTLVANCARQTYRSLRRRSVEQSRATLPVEIADPRTTSVIAGSRLDFLDALEKLEAHRPELVPPLVLRDVCQLDYQEIAGQLGIPVGTLKSRIHHARRHVRESLQGGDDGAGLGTAGGADAAGRRPPG
ncbi:sigma-70 family RNA polymerase sigma factor [Micromonospora sp. C28SCA-DRY-2]|uniref:RNA polymerase sigma factor n=1 Tax=Micromonospora sp. C28SCA-DRY-2 TaxID=3059522 RepID=UPI0026743DBB|nr:sigma-70 family RNA polymerase sigma factor [Micromonospora sp. C28SCA-DRY-2]MDO3703223.1 sigma-70 family RNA polymerase sigma factor [Micromonospora sp. C28SCA-DRY-2]